jgi:tRNA threonylcarbamoyl adenosine modification protein YeaZ
VTAGVLEAGEVKRTVIGDGAGELTSRLSTGFELAELAPNKHGEELAPLIERVLEMKSVRPAELEAVAVGLGPGPFTGLRVGIMTAKAMGDALGIPVFGVCSLDAIASAGGLDVPTAVITDARRKQVYWRPYDDEARPFGEPDLGRPEDVAAALRGKVEQVVGAGAAMYAEAFAEFPMVERHTESQGLYPAANAICNLVIRQLAAGTASTDLTPLYLRRPDATPSTGRPKPVTPS